MFTLQIAFRATAASRHVHQIRLALQVMKFYHHALIELFLDSQSQSLCFSSRKTVLSWRDQTEHYCISSIELPSDFWRASRGLYRSHGGRDMFRSRSIKHGKGWLVFRPAGKTSPGAGTGTYMMSTLGPSTLPCLYQDPFQLLVSCYPTPLQTSSTSIHSMCSEERALSILLQTPP